MFYSSNSVGLVLTTQNQNVEAALAFKLTMNVD